jgi:hypothetical protein
VKMPQPNVFSKSLKKKMSERVITIVRSPELGQVLDVFLASSAILILVFYHVWYYSWRFTNLVEGRGYHRVDITGQRARVGCNALL